MGAMMSLPNFWLYIYKKKILYGPPFFFCSFMKETRHQHLDKSADKRKQSAELNKELGQLWQQMSREAQEPYYEMAKKAKEEHAKMVKKINK